MKNKGLLSVGFLYLFLLGGCSGPPGVDDVKEGIIDVWKPCQLLVKPIDFKKLNGIDNGRTYQLDINYQLLIVADIPADMFGGNSLLGTCLAGGASVGDATDMSNIFMNLVRKNPKIIQNEVIKSGQTLDVTTSYDMIKSEEGWVIQ